MKTKKIGKSELEVVPFALGGNVFGWTADEKTSFEILDAYISTGFNFIDTADIYSVWHEGNKGGESETIIGNWLNKSKKRSEIILSTKVGAQISETHRGLKKDYILREVEDSLKRLQTDYIDLYFTHFDDLTTPVEETLEAYDQLVKAGKVRYIASSNTSAERVKESLECSRKNNFPEYVCLQPQYNLYDREGYEKEYEQLAKDENLGVIPYYSLASGFLTGKYSTIEDIANSSRKGQLQNYINPKGQAILDALNKFAKEYNTTPAQIALAWLAARPSITAPIASVSKASQLDILKFIDLNLSGETIEELTNIST